MAKKEVLFPVCAFIVFSVFLMNFVSANIVINEVMYDFDGSDDNHEWIEIKNVGQEEINLSGWKFYENGVNHGLSCAQGDFLMQPGDYAVIAENAPQFLIDYPAFSGKLFDSSFSLSNTGENIAIKNKELEIVNEVNYSNVMGARGDGNSLQLAETWCANIPTPGTLNNCQIQENQTSYCGDGVCDTNESCANCSADCSCSENYICQDNICIEEQQTQEEQQSNETEETNETDEINEINYNITLPNVIASEEEFTVKVEINNDQNISRAFDLWSYVYRGNKCYSCYWGKTRESNKQTVSLNARELKTVELKDKVNASEGNYSLKVKILKSGLLTPKEFTYNVNVAGKIIIINKSKVNETNKQNESKANESEIEKKQEAGITGETISENKEKYEAQSEKTKKTALYIFTFLMLGLIVYVAFKDKFNKDKNK